MADSDHDINLEVSCLVMVRVYYCYNNCDWIVHVHNK